MNTHFITLYSKTTFNSNIVHLHKDYNYSRKIDLPPVLSESHMHK